MKRTQRTVFLDPLHEQYYFPIFALEGVNSKRVLTLQPKLDFIKYANFQTKPRTISLKRRNSVQIHQNLVLVKNHLIFPITNVE